MSVPKGSDYEGRVVILKQGLGTPQIGIDGERTELVEDIIKRRLGEPQIED